MSKTTYESNRVGNARYGGGTYTKPATVYIALFTSAPGVSGGGTEVSGGAYARAAVSNDASNWPNMVSGLKANAIEIPFAEASSAWGIITHAAIFDALTGGNMQDFNALDTPINIPSGAQFKLPVGSVRIVES